MILRRSDMSSISFRANSVQRLLAGRLSQGSPARGLSVCPRQAARPLGAYVTTPPSSRYSSVVLRSHRYRSVVLQYAHVTQCPWILSPGTGVSDTASRISTRLPQVLQGHPS